MGKVTKRQETIAKSAQGKRLSTRLKYDRKAASQRIPIEDYRNALRQAAIERDIALADPKTPRPGLSARGLNFANGS